MKQGILLVVLLLSGSRALPQYNDYGKIWLNGGGVILYKSDFLSSPPVNSNSGLSPNIFLGHGHSNICDSLGNLLLITDGLSIYNANGDTIDGGYKLVPEGWYQLSYPSNLAEQGSLLLPSGKNKYHFITAVPSDSMLIKSQDPNYSPVVRDLLLYSLVDMNANNGAGKVIKRKIPLITGAEMSFTQMMACRHGDGKSWWLLKQAHDTNMVYKFLFANDTVYGPYYQGFAQPHFGVFHNGGQSVFSQDGTKYATTARGAGKVFVADFNRCSGMLSNPKTFDVPQPAIYYDNGNFAYHDVPTESVAFSPNGRFLYVGKYSSIMQLDLWDNNLNTAWDTIARLDTTWAAFAQYSSLYLGPDDKIYVGNWNVISAQMSVINNPDNKGVACGFCPRCFRFPVDPISGGSVSSPPNMPNYELGAASPPCTVGVEDEPEQKMEFSVYPNPTTGMVTVKYSIAHGKAARIVITDVYGRIILQTKLNAHKSTTTIDLSHHSSGVYFYSIAADGIEYTNGKLILNN